MNTARNTVFKLNLNESFNIPLSSSDRFYLERLDQDLQAGINSLLFHGLDLSGTDLLTSEDKETILEFLAVRREIHMLATGVTGLMLN